MPKRSDRPYPEAVYSQIHDASTFERYQFIRDFPEDLQKKAKAAAALQGVTLGKIVAEALTAYLKKQEQKRAKKKGG